MSDSFAEVLSNDADRQNLLEADHAALRDTQAWGDEQRRLERATFGLIDAVRTTAIAFTRYPYANRWLLQSVMDEFIETAYGTWLLAAQGLLNTAQREARYLLELAVKCTYVDQQLPGDTELSARHRWLHENVPRSSVSVAPELRWFILASERNIDGKVSNCFAQLSAVTHPSLPQLEARARRAARKEYIGLESLRTLRAHVDRIVEAYDLILVLILNGVGKQFSSDVLGVLEAQHWRPARGSFAFKAAEELATPQR